MAKILCLSRVRREVRRRFPYLGTLSLLTTAEHHTRTSRTYLHYCTAARFVTSEVTIQTEQDLKLERNIENNGRDLHYSFMEDFRAILRLGIARNIMAFAGQPDFYELTSTPVASS